MFYSSALFILTGLLLPRIAGRPVDSLFDLTTNLHVNTNVDYAEHGQIFLTI